MNSTVSAVNVETRIARNIFQTYRTSELPTDLARNVQILREMNPKWEYRFFNDEQVSSFIEAEYGSEVLACYNSINPLYGAARADLFRYLVVYKFGGVYLDIKSSMKRPLDDILLDEDRFILSHWKNDPGEERANWGMHSELEHVQFGEYQQWHVISAAGHPFLMAVIQECLAEIKAYRPWVHGVKNEAVVSVTGPILYTRVIHGLREQYPHREVRSEEELGLIYSFAPGFSHRHFFGHHYTNILRPLIVRGGIYGMLDEAYVWMMKARNIVAVKTYPFRKKLRGRD